MRTLTGGGDAKTLLLRPFVPVHTLTPARACLHPLEPKSHHVKLSQHLILLFSSQKYSDYEKRYLSWPSYAQYGFNDYNPGGYDAIWAAALALNASIEILAKQV